MNKGQLSLWDINRVKFIKDTTGLHKSFICNSVHQYLFEHENNFIIKINGVFYGPLKENCVKLEEYMKVKGEKHN